MSFPPIWQDDGGIFIPLMFLFRSFKKNIAIQESSQRWHPAPTISWDFDLGFFRSDGNDEISGEKNLQTPWVQRVRRKSRFSPQQIGCLESEFSGGYFSGEPVVSFRGGVVKIGRIYSWKKKPANSRAESCFSIFHQRNRKVMICTSTKYMHSK